MGLPIAKRQKMVAPLVLKVLMWSGQQLGGHKDGWHGYEDLDEEGEGILV